MSSYFDMVKQTYIEAWPAEICRLSIAQADVPLTVREALVLGRHIEEWWETFEDDKDDPVSHHGSELVFIRERVRNVVARFPNGCFVRLGSRSPKDCWEGIRDGFKILATDADPLRFITGCSERMADDLRMAIANNYAPYIWARQWFDIPAWAEFRCFMKGRKLVGISQYDYLDGQAHAEITGDPGMIEWAIERNFFERFKAASHLDDVVFDVFLKALPHPEGRQVEVKLLEINPMCEMTDPCLFSWRGGGDFDGTFRFIKTSRPKPNVEDLLAKKESA